MDWGTLTTRALALEGDQLFVNSVGQLTVEVLDAAGNVLGGADVSGDSFRHAVAFVRNSLRKLAGSSPIRLRFSVPPESQLYSFTVN